jgi:hypothetical protein
MKTLIAVVSCRSRQNYADAIRNTWLPLVPADKADVRFFVGRGEHTEFPADVVELDCDDSYQGLPEKVRCIVRWALTNGYDHALKCDDDVVLLPVDLLQSGYERYDFVGHRSSNKALPAPYGFCYWMSRRSMEIVAESELPSTNYDEGWVTLKLQEKGIDLHHDARYHLHLGKRTDFVSKRAPLRAPPRTAPAMPTPASGTFAWCMYIAWVGYKLLPAERNIAEMKKVFAEAIAKSSTN